MKYIQRILMILISPLALTLAAGLGCSSSPPFEQSPPARAWQEDILTNSSLEITYVLGHDQHRLLAQGQVDSYKIQTFLDRQLLKEGNIEKINYLDLLKKATAFMDSTQRLPATNTPCRAPFSIIIRVQGTSRSHNGCRTTQEGSALSRITRDAEFLLYSKK